MASPLGFASGAILDGSNPQGAAVPGLIGAPVTRTNPFGGGLPNPLTTGLPSLLTSGVPSPLGNGGPTTQCGPAPTTPPGPPAPPAPGQPQPAPGDGGGTTGPG